MALVVTAISPSYDIFLYYFTLVITPMFLLSGVFFPLQGAPEWVQAGSGALPLSHAVDIVRPLMTGRPLEGVLGHLLVPLLYAFGGLWLALAMLRRRLLI